MEASVTFLREYVPLTDKIRDVATRYVYQKVEMSDKDGYIPLGEIVVLYHLTTSLLLNSYLILFYDSII